MQLLEFIPFYMERVWGGRAFESKLGRQLPEGKRIGESWEIVDRPEQQSIVAEGPYSGQTLRELLMHSASEILGPNHDPQQPFPILVKWLDCSERLSLQVHPPAEVASRLGGKPKTEHWYIADTDNDASIIAGLRPGVTRELFESALVEKEFDACVECITTNKGDSILVKSGCIHAINAGNLILEIQSNSDTTYRLYDWNRAMPDGTQRTLHTREALQSIDFNLSPVKLCQVNETASVLAECDEFRIRKFELEPGDSQILFPANEQTRLFHVISGRLRDTHSKQTMESSKNYLQPFVTELSLIAETKATLLVTDQFYNVYWL